MEPHTRRYSSTDLCHHDLSKIPWHQIRTRASTITALTPLWLWRHATYIIQLESCYNHQIKVYSDVIMSMILSEITGVSIVYSYVCSGLDQRKYQSSASLTFVQEIHLWLANSPHKGPVTQKCFHLMTSLWISSREVGRSATRQFLCYWRVRLLTAIKLHDIRLVAMLCNNECFYSRQTSYIWDRPPWRWLSW